MKIRVETKFNIDDEVWRLLRDFSNEWSVSYDPVTVKAFWVHGKGGSLTVLYRIKDTSGYEFEWWEDKLFPTKALALADARRRNEEK